MKIHSKLGVAFLLMSIFNSTQAEYTAKIFIEGVSMGTGGGTGGESTLPPSDPTEQSKGDSDFLVKLSRTTAYQGEIVSLTVEQNSADCFYSELVDSNANVIPLNEGCISWGDSIPFSRNINSNLTLGNNTINVYQVPTLGNGDTPLASQTFNLNILTPPEEENSDGNLKYTVSRRSLPVAEYVYINFYSNTYSCVGLKHIESGTLIDYGYCGVASDYISFSPNNSLDPTYTGTQNFALIGYEPDANNEPLAGTITEYPFALNIIPESTPPLITDDTYSENRTPYNTFNSFYFGQSTIADNIIVFGLINADSLSVSDDNGYISGFRNVTIDGENPLSIRSSVSTTVDLTATATNENGTTTRNFSYFMNKTTIDEIDIKWCSYQATDSAFCNVFQTGSNGSAAIWDGGSGDSFSFTFSANNAECVTLSSSNDRF